MDDTQDDMNPQDEGVDATEESAFTPEAIDEKIAEFQKITDEQTARLEHALAWYKARASEESPAAVHRQLARATRACNHIARMADPENLPRQNSAKKRNAYMAYAGLRERRGNNSAESELYRVLDNIRRVAMSAVSEEPIKRLYVARGDENEQ